MLIKDRGLKDRLGNGDIFSNPLYPVREREGEMGVDNRGRH